MAKSSLVVSGVAMFGTRNVASVMSKGRIGSTLWAIKNASVIVENTFFTFLTCGKQKKYISENLVQERYATCMILFFYL